MTEGPIHSSEPLELSKSKTGRSIQTLFRVTMRQQINHIAIADNKAGMIIGINTLVIGIVMTVLGSGVGLNDNGLLSKEQLSIPLGILMVMCLISAVFSIMATKPKIIKTISDIPPIKQSRLFFGYINEHSQDEYLEEMFDILGSNEAIHKNLVIDIHNQGQILHKKYARLHWAYSFFMLGLIGSVTAFLAILVLTN